MKNEHTPGPWTCGATSLPHVIMKNGNVWMPQYEGNPNDEANAKLIAAAPDMLEALERILSDYDIADHDESLPLTSVVQAEKAVKKAKGL